MNTFLTLIRREFWENRGSFVTAPAVVSILMLFVAILMVSGVIIFQERIDADGFFDVLTGKYVPPADELKTALNIALWVVSTIFNMVLVFVIFFYLLGSLYDDRKDRSILFWKSMPVSDLMTVLSKLFSALVLAPIVTICLVAITHILGMAILSVLPWKFGISAYELLWGPAEPTGVWARLFLAYMVQALWALPVYGWLMLVSAFARSKTFLWAILPPLMGGLLLTWINAVFFYTRSGSWLLQEFFTRLFGGVVPAAISVQNDGSEFALTDVMGENGMLTFSGLLERLTLPDMWIGVAVGIVFLAGAIYIRRFRSEI